MWAQVQEFTAADVAPDLRFGYLVALDANTAVVTAPKADAYRGAAYVFERRDGVWTQGARLQAADGVAGDWFGASAVVAGDTAAIGATGRAGKGAVYVFTRASGVWTQRAVLTATPGASGDLFGAAVGLSGRLLAASAPGNDDRPGSVSVFRGSGASWSRSTVLDARDDPADTWFGYSLGLTGFTLVVGSPTASARSGHAVVYALSGVDVRPGGLTFARTPAGFESPAQAITVRNRRDVALTVSTSVDGDLDDFELSPAGIPWVGNFSLTMNPGATGTILVRYYPGSAGPSSAVLRLQTDDAFDSLVEVPLFGESADCVASPSRGTVGTVVSVRGAGFGRRKGRLLLLGGPSPVALRVTRWSAGRDPVVRGVVARPVAAGAYRVCVAPPHAAQIVDPAPFTIVVPAILDVAPRSGAAGRTVVLECAAAGTTRGSVFLQAPGGGERIRCKVTAWPRSAVSGTDRSVVRFRVPKKLVASQAYDVVLTNGVGEARAAGAFTATP